MLVTAVLSVLALPSGAEELGGGDPVATAPGPTTTTAVAIDPTSPAPDGPGTTLDSPATTLDPTVAALGATTTTTAPVTTTTGDMPDAPAPPPTAGDGVSTPALVATPAAPALTVSPSTGLVQGDVVTVTGTGYPANSTIGVIQCKLLSSSVDDCNLSTLSYAMTDASGSFSTSYSPRRILTVAGTGIDCADAAACKLGAGDVIDQDQSADAAIRFDPAVPPPPPPTLTVTPSTLLLDGQTVTVTGAGYVPNRSVGVIQCPDPALTSGANCAFSTLQFVTPDASGAFSVTVRVTRIIRANGATTDCADLGACLIGAGTGAADEGADASIRFDPSVPPPPPPTLAVTPSTDLLDGQAVTVSGANFPANAAVTLTECLDPAATPSLTCTPFGYVSAPTDATGAFSVTYPVARIVRTFDGRTDCAGLVTCVIAAGSYSPGELVAAIAFDASVPPPPPPTIVVTPSTDLLDGDTVRVTGSGFDPDAPVALAECAVGLSPLGGCTPSYSGVTVAADGTFATDLVVDRITYLPDGTPVDCAQPDACVVSAVDFRFGEEAATAPVRFDPSVAPPPPPSITVTPSQDLADGQLVEVSGSGFPRRQTVGIVECRAASGQDGCDLSNLLFVLTDEDGRFRADMELYRYLQVDIGEVDCAQPDACRVGAGIPPSGVVGDDAPIQFDPDAPPPPPATLTITPGGALDDDQLVTVTGTGFPYRHTVAVVQCRPGAGEPGCDLSNVIYVQPGRDRSFTVQYRVKRMISVDVGAVDCAVAGRCELAAGTLPDGRTNAIVDIVVGAPRTGPTTPTDPGGAVESATTGRSGGSGGSAAVAPAFTG